MTYHVTVSVEGYYEWDGEADSIEEAKHLALEEAGEADFEELTDVDYEVCDWSKEDD